MKIDMYDELAALGDRDAFDDKKISDIQDAANELVGRLDTLAREQVRLKDETEQRWQEDMNLYEGRYDSDDASKKEENIRSKEYTSRSKIFVNLIRSKTDTEEARLADILFPSDDKNYEISPTPVPELADQAKEAAERAKVFRESAAAQRAKGAQLQSQGQPAEIVDPIMQAANDSEAAAEAEDDKVAQANELAALEKIEADRRAERMGRKLDDYMVEGRYSREGKRALRDACRLGSGIMKGPFKDSTPRHYWRKSNKGDFSSSTRHSSRPKYRRVDPWHFFPEMIATDVEDAEFTFERHLPSKTMLRKMAKTHGFSRQAVRTLLKRGPGYGNSYEGLDRYTEIKKTSDDGGVSWSRYVLWEYHGPLEPEEIALLIAASGREGSAKEARDFLVDYDPLETDKVIVHFCDGILLKVAEYHPLDSGESLYSVFSYAHDDNSILGGIGIPRRGRAPALAFATAWRLMIDNAKLSSGPQILVNKAVLEPEDGDYELKAFKVWNLNTDNDDVEQPPMNLITIECNQTYLANVIALARELIDDETNIMRFAQGDGAEATQQTAHGMAMLVNLSSVTIRNVVRNFDENMTVPNIRRFYDWEMQFGDDETVKGDMQVDARGARHLLAKEIEGQNLMALAERWTQHPRLQYALKEYKIQKMVMRSLGIDPNDVLIDEKSFEARIAEIEAQAAAAAEAQNQPSGDMLMRREVAGIEAQAKIQVAGMSAQVDQYQSDRNVEIAMLQLADKRDVKLAEIAANLEGIARKVDGDLQKSIISATSKENLAKFEFDADRFMAGEARARGEKPAGSGGLVSAGTA